MSASRPSAAVKLLLPVVALVISLIAAVIGALWTSSANSTLSAALTSQTGTAADVYGSQSLIVVSSALLSAGIIGVVVSLAALGILIGLGAFARPDTEPAADAFADDAEYGEYERAEEAVPAGAVPAAAAPAAQAAAPVAATPATPARPADEPLIETSANDAPDVPATPTEAPTTSEEADRRP
ncbi:hypothetical protein [Agromyces aerolatus]|uniref:hypothetical protein n=1 Tax=Agromyces sp. LY-1074 TaxID=3074080 RepID=UPI002863F0D8|nr:MULTISPECIES: hypothetical protein [unclassified Agromyces]MDR5701139.1 hypothetical protein [Agromyces sp. LY-1074]MDR5707779.1 hypothetical protein [Agromyces sp. LY-1358]